MNMPSGRLSECSCDVGGSFGGDKCQDVTFKERQRKLVTAFAEKLIELPEEFYDVMPIPDGTVPIVKFAYKCTTGLKCDLSFKSGMGHQNNALVK